LRSAVRGVAHGAWVAAAATILSIGAARPSQQASAAAPDGVQAFVKAALTDRFQANDIPDFKILGTSYRIAIRSTMPEAAMTLTDAALPAVNGYQFFLLSPADAQTAADRRHESVSFITVDRPRIEGDRASIWLGVDVAEPADSNMIWLCCCRGEAEFRRTSRGWSFVKWGTTRCS
jgi:hypothetical protein